MVTCLFFEVNYKSINQSFAFALAKSIHYRIQGILNASTPAQLSTLTSTSFEQIIVNIQILKRLVRKQHLLIWAETVTQKHYKENINQYLLEFQKETLLLREILVINEDTLQALAVSLSKFECSKLSSIYTYSEQRGEISIQSSCFIRISTRKEWSFVLKRFLGALLTIIIIIIIIITL